MPALFDEAGRHRQHDLRVAVPVGALIQQRFEDAERGRKVPFAPQALAQHVTGLVSHFFCPGLPDGPFQVFPGFGVPLQFQLGPCDVVPGLRFQVVTGVPVQENLKPRNGLLVSGAAEGNLPPQQQGFRDAAVVGELPDEAVQQLVRPGGIARGEQAAGQ